MDSPSLRAWLLASSVSVLSFVVATAPVDAHKPITSPFTFYDDVLPITRAKCAACHAPDGIAPMSLLRHEDAVPWGESMKLELIAGHMPPWSSATPQSAFRHTPTLTARELNVLLTWAVGGTPPGDTTPPAEPGEPSGSWPLGPPDSVLELPETALEAGTPAATREFVVPLDGGGRRLAAVDLGAGTPSIVRSARVSVRRQGASAATERVLGLWVPGDQPSKLPDGSGWTVDDRSELVVRVAYKKRWDREREPATDRSRLGLYFVSAGEGREATAAALVAEGEAEREPTGSMVLRARHIATGSSSVAAVWPDTAMAGARVRLEKASAGGARTLVGVLEPRAGWERRYWLATPLALEPGESLQLTATWPRGAQSPPAGTRLMGLDVLPGRP
jgi:hypothetical protein